MQDNFSPVHYLAGFAALVGEKDQAVWITCTQKIHFRQVGGLYDRHSEQALRLGG
jgi:hypothetical protein